MFQNDNFAQQQYLRNKQKAQNEEKWIQSRNGGMVNVANPGSNPMTSSGLPTFQGLGVKVEEQKPYYTKVADGKFNGNDIEAQQTWKQKQAGTAGLNDEKATDIGMVRGGRVPGKEPNRPGDNRLVPMRSGEYVLPVKTAKKLGKPMLDKLVEKTNGKKPMGGKGGRGFETGGEFDPVLDEVRRQRQIDLSKKGISALYGTQGRFGEKAKPIFQEQKAVMPEVKGPAAPTNIWTGSAIAPSPEIKTNKAPIEKFDINDSNYTEPRKKFIEQQSADPPMLDKPDAPEKVVGAGSYLYENPDKRNPIKERRGGWMHDASGKATGGFARDETERLKSVAQSDADHERFMQESAIRNAKDDAETWNAKLHRAQTPEEAIIAKEGLASARGMLAGYTASQDHAKTRAEDSKWKREEAKSRREDRASESKEKEAIRHADAKYKTDALIRANALKASTDKEGNVDEERYARLVDADTKLASGYQRKVIVPAAPETKDSGWLGTGMMKKKIPAVKEQVEWVAPKGVDLGRSKTIKEPDRATAKMLVDKYGSKEAAMAAWEEMN